MREREGIKRKLKGGATKKRDKEKKEWKVIWKRKRREGIKGKKRNFQKRDKELEREVEN